MKATITRRTMLGSLTVGATMLAAPALLAQTSPLRIKFGSFFTSTNPLWTKILEPYFQTLSAATNGAVSVEFVPAGMNIRGSDVADTLKAGVIDMALNVGSYNPGRFAALSVSEIPLLANNAREASIGLAAVAKAGLLDGFDDMTLLGVGTADVGVLHHGESVSSLSDFNGAKIRSANPAVAAMIESMGGVAIGMPITQVAEALSRGVINGSACDWASLLNFGIGDVTRTHVTLPLGLPGVWAAFNPLAYDRLPEEIRTQVDAHSGLQFSRAWGDGLANLSASVQTMLTEKADHQIIAPTEAELAKAKEVAAPIEAKWAAETPDGQAILDAFRAGMASEG